MLIETNFLQLISNKHHQMHSYVIKSPPYVRYTKLQHVSTLKGSSSREYNWFILTVRFNTMSRQL
jgi:hypothetical protein